MSAKSDLRADSNEILMYPAAEISEAEMAEKFPDILHQREMLSSPEPAPAISWEVVAGKAAGKKLVLHVGSGPSDPRKLNNIFRSPEWAEVRLDIDENVNPDIVGTITDLSGVPDGAVDALWSSHNIEHIYAHEVPLAMREFARVLKPGGILLITCPDLKSVARMIANGEITKTVYKSVDGTRPITPLDMVYGWGAQIADGRTYMAHRTGFTSETLGSAIHKAGFPQVHLATGRAHDLWALAYKGENIQDRGLLARAIG